MGNATIGAICCEATKDSGAQWRAELGRGDLGCGSTRSGSA